jgi:hypothetical protein
VARYRKEESITGVYFDKIVHYVIHPFVFYSIGWGEYQISGRLGVKLLGFITAMAFLIMRASTDLKDSAILESLKAKGGSFIINVSSPKTKENPGLMLRVFSFLHKLCTFPVAINVITISAILNLVLNSLFFHVLNIYAVLASFVCTVRIAKFIITKQVDDEMKGFIK